MLLVLPGFGGAGTAILSTDMNPASHSYGRFSLARLALIAAVGAVALPSPVRADNTATGFDPRTVFTIHVELPLTAWTVWKYNSFVSLVNASFAARFAGIAEIEAGGGPGRSISEHGNFGTVRAGLSPSVLRARPEGTHWNLRVPMLVGLRSFSGSSFDGCHQCGEVRLRTVTASTGLDATHWGMGHIGFNIRLLGGVGLPYLTWPDEHQWSGPVRAVELSLSIGVSVK